jgi:hypothetical protein
LILEELSKEKEFNNEILEKIIEKIRVDLNKYAEPKNLTSTEMGNFLKKVRNGLEGLKQVDNFSPFAVANLRYFNPI